MEWIEAQQITNRLTQTQNKDTAPIRRYGTDFVNLEEMEIEEVDYLLFADEIKRLQMGEDPRFYGISSGATLVKKAMDFKGAFTGEPVSIPFGRSQPPQIWEDHAVRFHGFYLAAFV
jgi:hypothetical protein